MGKTRFLRCFLPGIGILCRKARVICEEVCWRRGNGRFQPLNLICCIGLCCCLYYSYNRLDTHGFMTRFLGCFVEIQIPPGGPAPPARTGAQPTHPYRQPHPPSPPSSPSSPRTQGGVSPCSPSDPAPPSGARPAGAPPASLPPGSPQGAPKLPQPPAPLVP